LDIYQSNFLEKKFGFDPTVRYQKLIQGDLNSAEFIFLLDRSGSMEKSMKGSMEGSPLEKAKEALGIFISSIPPNCKFNIVL
jgi:uncharacterized protein with von Willebrand factor type A (vWA) domain